MKPEPKDKELHLYNGHGDNWDLFGVDVERYEKGELILKYGCEEFKDKRSRYVDSSD
jgi:hypothetical protein